MCSIGDQWAKNSRPEDLSGIPETDPKAFLATAPEYYQTYIQKVGDQDILKLLEEQAHSFSDFIKEIPPEMGGYRYQPGKWTVKEVIGHCLDTERVFGHRINWFLRHSPDPLPGFDQDDWIRNSGYARVSLKDLADEWYHTRQSHIYLYRSMRESDLYLSGKANEVELSIMAMLCIQAGHVIHHSEVLKERYL